MKLKEGSIKRCAIFLYYDRQGIVDDYVIYLLNDLNKNIDKLLIVCNGTINEESEMKFRTVTDDILLRSNSGFDVGGYREGLFQIGFENLQRYDEVVLLNYTFFGPLYPFKEMFDEMAKRDLDFWGITNHFEVNPDPFGKNRYGVMPEHLQSHFLVVRKNMILSNEYREFMINMKNPASYVDSICDYESIFQKHFTDLGFKGEAYCDAKEYAGYVYNPVMFRTKEMIVDKRCPIIKRRSFFTDYNDFLLNSCGEATVEAYKYIKDNLKYDTNMIWDNLLRLENMTEISRAMQLRYVLPEKGAMNSYCPYDSIILLVNVENVRHLDDYTNYLYSLTNKIKFIFMIDEKNCKAIDKIIEVHSNSEIVLRKNESHLIGFLCEFLKNIDTIYKYIGVLNIRDYEIAQPYSNMVSWEYSDWKNLVATNDLVKNIITTFENNERLGLLIPPIPNFGNVYEQIADGWMGKFHQVKEWLEKYNLLVNVKIEDEPLAPYGGSFWMRRESFNCILNMLVEREEKKVELMAMPFIAQISGFYTGIVYNDSYVSNVITNEDYMMRETNKAVFKQFGPSYHKIVVERVKEGKLKKTLSRSEIAKLKTKKVIKKVLPTKMYEKGKVIYKKLR